MSAATICRTLAFMGLILDVDGLDSPAQSGLVSRQSEDHRAAPMEEEGTGSHPHQESTRHIKPRLRSTTEPHLVTITHTNMPPMHTLGLPLLTLHQDTVIDMQPTHKATVLSQFFHFNFSRITVLINRTPMTSSTSLVFIEWYFSRCVIIPS